MTTPSRKSIDPRAPCGSGTSYLGLGIVFLANARRRR